MASLVEDETIQGVAYTFSSRDAFSDCFKAMNNLKYIESECDLTSFNKDQINTLKFELSFLETIVLYEKINHARDENLKGLLNVIGEVVRDAYLSSVLLTTSKLINNGDGVSFDLMFHDIMENIEYIRARAREHYHVRLSSSEYFHMNSQQAERILLQLLKNIKTLLSSKAYLFSPLKKEIEGFEERLRFLANFLQIKEVLSYYINSGGLLKSNLLSQIVFIVDHAALACISFFFWTDKISESVFCRVKQTLGFLIWKLKIIRLELNKIFIGFHLAAGLLQLDTFEISNDNKEYFVNFLLHNLRVLLDKKVGANIPVIGHVEALQEELRSFITSPIDPDHPIFMHIEVVKSDIISFDEVEIQKDLEREMMILSVSRLQEDVKHMYDEGTLDFQIYKTRKDCWMVHHFDDITSQCLEWQDNHRSASHQLHHIIDKLKLCTRFSAYDMHKICIAIKYGMLDEAYFHLSYSQLFRYKEYEEDYILNNNEAVVGLLCSLLGNLEVILVYHKLIGMYNKFIRFRGLIKILIEKLRFLRDVLNFMLEEKNEQENMCTFLNQVKVVTVEAISFSCQWYICKDDERIYWLKFLKDMCYLTLKIDKIVAMVNKLWIKEFEREIKKLSFESPKIVINLIHDEFEKLLNGESNWKIPLKRRIETLCKSLEIDSATKHENYDVLFTSIADFVIKAKALIQYPYPKTLSKVKAKETDSALMDLIFAMNLISAQFILLEMLNSKTILSTQQEQVETLQTGIKFLIEYLIDLPRQYIHHEKYNHRLRLIEVVANEATDVISLHFINAINNVSQLHFRMTLLLVKIKLIEAKVGLVSVVDILNCKSNLVDLVVDGVETLQQGFEFLEILLLDLPEKYNEDEKLNNLVELVDKVTIGTRSIISSIQTKEMKVEIAGEINQCIFGLLDKIEEIKMQAKKNFPKVYRSRFPSSYILSFLEFLIEKCKDFLRYKPNFVSTIANQIQSLQEELEFLINYLGEISMNQNENDELKIWAHVADVTYEVEYVIDSFISSKGGTFWKDMISHCRRKVDLLKMEVTNIYGRKLNANALLPTTDLITNIQVNVPKMSEVVVGFEDEENSIKEKLFNGCHELDVISIVGMPGLGKTTLAMKIYDFCSMVNPCPFDVCLSYCVSQTYEKKDLLLAVLRKISDNPKELFEKNEDNLSEQLQKSLKGKRYLIFLDDIWSRDVWDDLRRLFPNEDNKSRIILTTRLEEVASYAMDHGKPHYLRFFTLEESWSLLKQKLFQNETFPSELEDVGRIIAEKCRGLPLSVVLIAGLLNKNANERKWWESIAKSFSSHIDTLGFGVLELSYNHLPPYLKPCFLYFGRFKEDEEVKVSNLLWLWIAEGFIQDHKPCNEEIQVTNQVIKSQELAYNYLMDLVGKSLVMKTKIAHDGKIKACRVHDLIHEFCQKKAIEENFLLQINGDHCADSPHCYSKKPASRHLSIFSEWETFVEWKPSKSPVRSLIVKPTNVDDYYLSNISFILQSFNLLRVLDLRYIYIANFRDELEHLIHLRYLAVRTVSNSIPSSIANLWNLQTFLFLGQYHEVSLPERIWSMVHLKNVHINSSVSLGQHKYRPEFFENMVQLSNLETFSTPSLSYGDDMENIIMRMSNLWKLKCIFSEPSGSSKKLPVLNSLGALESLKIRYRGERILHPCEFNIPSNLKKLSLSGFLLQWSEISQLGALQNLEVLKLMSSYTNGFEGEEWVVEEKEFPNLKLLKLEGMNLVRWNVSDDVFPCLEKLVLICCNKIKEMPIESLGSNYSLRSIEVRRCSESAAISTKEIQENLADLGVHLCVLITQDWK